LAKTGRRISELLDLRVKDIEWGQNRVLWHLRKPQREQRLPVSDEILFELRQYVLKKDLVDEDHVFKSSYNTVTHITRRRCDQIVKEIGERIGVTEVGEKGGPPHCHHFRHSFCVRLAKLIQTPADAKKASDLAGHVDPRVFMATYLQFSRGDLQELMAIDDSRGGINPPSQRKRELIEKI